MSSERTRLYEEFTETPGMAVHQVVSAIQYAMHERVPSYELGNAVSTEARDITTGSKRVRLLNSSPITAENEQLTNQPQFLKIEGPPGGETVEAFQLLNEYEAEHWLPNGDVERGEAIIDEMVEVLKVFFDEVQRLPRQYINPTVPHSENQ